MPARLRLKSPEKSMPRVPQRRSRPASVGPFQGRLHPVLQLQRAAGNRCVTQLIQAKRLAPKAKLVAVQGTPTLYRKLAAADSLLPLQRLLGNRHVARLLSTRSPGENLLAAVRIQRQPVPSAGDVREFVLSTIDYLKSAAEFFALATLDAARFEKVINNWYAMVVDREHIINDQLGANPGLISALRTAYMAALRALMTRASTDLKRSQADLYRENRGRVPMWAWQTPHRMETGISTPIAEGRVKNARTGEVTFATNGFNVTIFPDAIDRSLGSSGKTRINISWGSIGYRFGRDGRITRVTGPGAPIVHIRTRYGPRADPGGPSAYGRGTTPEDIAGGKVTPASTTLRFHGGSHGLDFVEFLERNPPPAFDGKIGMTVAELRAALAAWRKATTQYSSAINAFSTSHTDCVGTTIDEFKAAQARPGQRIELECSH